MRLLCLGLATCVTAPAEDWPQRRTGPNYSMIRSAPWQCWAPSPRVDGRLNQILKSGSTNNSSRSAANLKFPPAASLQDFQAAGNRRQYMGSDGVHWTGEGMELAGRAWGKTLDQIRFVLGERE